MRFWRRWSQDSCRSSYRRSSLESCEPRLYLTATMPTELTLEYFVEASTPETQATWLDSFSCIGLEGVQDDYGLTGAGQTVAVIDTGIAYEHLALGGGFGSGYRVVGGYDFAENDWDPYDDGPAGAHGTHVAGIIAGDDASGTGVAPGVDLVALRVFDDAGSGRIEWLEEALRWVHDNQYAFENPITTVNLSLGTQWNDDSPPAWSTLEDELAQLEADGIFIAVAAGNGFEEYGEPGLSYPAASSHVVPVSSVDANGQLSYFSQRHTRAIAAPGRAIRSSVPDYLGDWNGVDDDYASFSGTSMAAPYVAAASTLLREAFTLIGVGQVTSEQLIDVMHSTGDAIYDSVTGQTYRRLNLEQALAAILPADDFGSGTAAHALGTLTDTLSVSGMIGTQTDNDAFRFTAAQSGTVTVTFDAFGHLDPQWTVDGQAIAPDGSGACFSIDVVAGQTYIVGLGTSDGIGLYEIELELEATSGFPDYAADGQWEYLDQTISSDWQQFSLTAVRDGILTVEAFFNAGQGDVDLQLYDAHGTLLAGSYGTSSTERVDAAVVAGQNVVLYAYVSGSQVHPDVDLRVTNLVNLDGNTLSVFGTRGDDQIAFRAGFTHELEIGGVAYQFDGNAVRNVVIDGQCGNDQIVLVAGSGGSRAELRPGTATLSSQGATIQAENAEEIDIVAGSASDELLLVDSSGDDVLISRPGEVTLSGPGYVNRGQGFAVVRAYAVNGGMDQAHLYDTPGADVFIATPCHSTLRGDGYFVRARQFEAVHAYSTPGATDVARLHDSAGDDVLVATPTYTKMFGADFFFRAKEFDIVIAGSTAGGDDIARLYDSAGNDSFVGKPWVAWMVGVGFYNRVRGFEAVEAAATAGGNDFARLFDSSGNDTLSMTSRRAQLAGVGFSLEARAFDTVYAYATGGGVWTRRILRAGQATS